MERPSHFLQRSQPGTFCSKIPKRYIMAVLCYQAFFVMSWITLNFGVIIYHVLIQEDEERTNLYPKSLEWTWENLELMISSLEWGFVVGQIPGALCSTVYSAHKLLPISLSLSAIFHMILPLILNNHVAAVTTINFVQGFLMAPMFPAFFGLWKEWAPPTERSSIFLLAFSGYYLGIVASLPLGLYLINNLNVTTCYVVPGVSALIWSLLWCSITYDSPSNDPKITQSELLYLEEKIPLDSKVQVTLKSIPLKSILTSLPVISLCGVSFCSAFCIRMDITGLFLFQMGFPENPAHMAKWSESVPYVTFIFIVPLSGYLADYFIRKKNCNITIIRKVFCSGAFALHGILLFASCNPNAVYGTIFYNLALVILGFSLAGFIPNIMELSTRYVCIIMGLAGTFYALGDLAWPYVIEHFMPGDSLGEWWIIVVIEGLVSIIAAVIFCIFGSGHEQSWSSGAVPEFHKPADAHCYPKDNIEGETALVTDSL